MVRQTIQDLGRQKDVCFRNETNQRHTVRFLWGPIVLLEMGDGSAHHAHDRKVPDEWDHDIVLEKKQVNDLMQYKGCLRSSSGADCFVRPDDHRFQILQIHQIKHVPLQAIVRHILREGVSR